jgi:hypothetical protein
MIAASSSPVRWSPITVRAARGERARLVRAGIAGQCPHAELAVRVVDYGTGQSAALGAGGADDGNDLLLAHDLSLLFGFLRGRLLPLLSAGGGLDEGERGGGRDDAVQAGSPLPRAPPAPRERLRP